MNKEGAQLHPSEDNRINDLLSMALSTRARPIFFPHPVPPINWWFWTVVLEKTLESPCKEIQPVHPKGHQSWVFIGKTDVEAETPIVRPPDVKSWLIWKDPDAGKDWGQEEKGMTRIRWLDGITDSMDMGLGGLQ